MYAFKRCQYLKHHGVQGQKWGVRNGPPYPLDRNGVVFISGSSKTQDKNSAYYRQNLPKFVTDKIDGYMKAKKQIIVGDAPGIDRQVQNYLDSKHYKNVIVYSPGTECRYLKNQRWTNVCVNSKYEKGSKEWLAAKDIEMSNKATEGLAIVLDEGAKATRKNVDRLRKSKKNVDVYTLSKHGKKFDA